MLTLGSLFDGSGGFPLAGVMNGFEPVWASEVEPYPIAVARSRFPQMLHLGNVCDVNGAMVKPVDVITFGSPCQSLSVAGKREGLRHTDLGDDETTRSGLFMEAVTFWQTVRDTHAEINGKPQKTYKREQMLKWYNNLHTDSAEFKMWGNGIALPCAHFVLNRIAKELTNHDNQNPTADA